jgi:hypothetical protein
MAYRCDRATRVHRTYLLRPLILNLKAHTITPHGKKKPPSVAIDKVQDTIRVRVRIRVGID